MSAARVLIVDVAHVSADFVRKCSTLRRLAHLLSEYPLLADVGANVFPRATSQCVSIDDFDVVVPTDDLRPCCLLYVQYCC